MSNKNIFQNYTRERAQAIVEFAIVLPILLMVLVGIFEAGRMLFFYAAVNNASREAVRYASAYGLSDTPGVAKYNDCAGIKDAARRSAFFVNYSITLKYDRGLTNTVPPVPISETTYCSGSVDTITVNSGDRITVEVTTTYRPMMRLLPIGNRTFTSKSSRTVLGILELSYP